MTTTLAPPEGEPAPPEDRRSRPPVDRFAILVFAAVLAGLALRVAIGLTDDAPATDETAYLRSGVSLIEGDGFAREGLPELHFPPFVPFVLGVASRFFDDPHTGTVVMTVLFGTAMIVPLALLGRRVAGPVGGIATAWTAALAPGVSTMVVNRGAGSEAEYAFLVVTAVWCVVSAAAHRRRARTVRILIAGLLVGLAYLTRPEGLFMAVPLGVAVFALSVRGVSRREGRRPAIVNLAAFVAPVVVCIVPYAVYLHANTGQWQLTAKTQDASIEAWRAVADGDREGRDQVLYALDETGFGFAAGRSSLAALAREDPAGYLGIVGTNIAELWTAVVHPSSNRLLSWLMLPLPVWLVAGYGAWRHRRSRVAALIAAVAAVPVATALAFFVQPRYLVVTVALATVFVGAAVASVAGRVRRWLVVGVIGLLVLSSVQAFRGPGGWWHPADHSDQRAAGEWLAANTAPDDRVMTRSMVVEYYSDRSAETIPYADFDQILRYARHYGARYLVADWYTTARLRPQLQPLREADEVPGLRLVHEVRAEGRTTRIFALDPPPPASTVNGRPPGFMGDEPSGD